MASRFHNIIQLPDRTYQAIARAQLKSLAVEAGFSGHRLAEVEIVIAEITSNLVKHTSNGGDILARIIDHPGQKGLELISIDHGPGMSSTAAVIKDGVSSTNTLGHGLGAIKRLSDQFDMYSLRSWGTILYSLLLTTRTTKTSREEPLSMQVLQVSKQGENFCGDGYFTTGTERLSYFSMIDGLGHGEQAHQAAEEAIASMNRNINSQPCDILRKIHGEIRKTRGVVMSIAVIDQKNKQLSHCGVGNINSRLINLSLQTNARTFTAYNGIVGHTFPSTTNSTVLPWDSNLDMLIMHSDGISSKWDISKYPAILQHHPMITCAAIFKDHNRKTDDATVCCIRQIKSRA